MTTIKASGRDLELKSDQDIVFYPTSNIWISQGTKLIFEGTVPDDFEVKLQATSVTADRDIILPDASGTMATQEWANSQFTSQPVATITGATQANPVVITAAAAHNFTNGASVTITDVVGMTELNSNSYYVSVLTSTTAALYSDAGLTTGVDGTAFTAYVSDGVATQSLTANTDFNSLLNKPTTIAGYGITDPIVLSDSSVAAQPIRQYYANQAAFPSATDWHGAIAHSHSDGAMYFAHGGVWNKLTNDADAFDGAFTSLTGKPTTIAGYGITDAFDGAFTSLTGKPTTIAGYGITDGYTNSNVDSHLNQSTATTNQVLSWNGSDYDWIEPSSFQNVVDDTTPELGGDLNMNGNDITGTGNININGDISSTSAGTPTITSSTVINLTAGTGATDRVTVTQSPFKLASFTTTQRDAKTSEDGDLIYNSSNNQFELYTNTSWAAMTKVVYDNLLPSSDFVDQITNIWSANPTTPADFATWAQTVASDGYQYGDIDTSGESPDPIRSLDSLHWTNISTNNNPDPAHVTRWLDIVLPSLIEQSWFDVHTSNLVDGNGFNELRDDTTPQLGGDLDADGKGISNLGPVHIGQFGSVVFEGLSDDAFETTLIVTDPTADRTVTIPDATGEVVLRQEYGPGTNLYVDLLADTELYWGNTTNIRANDTSIDMEPGNSKVASFESSGLVIALTKTIKNQRNTNVYTTLRFDGTVNDPSNTIDIPKGDGVIPLVNSNGALELPTTTNTGTKLESIKLSGTNFDSEIVITEPTADRTITLPDASGTVALTSDLGSLQNLTTTQRDALTPSDGDIIYNTSNSQFELYTNTSWAAMTKVVYDNLLPSSDFVDQITNIWSANPTTPADFAAWAQTTASDGFEYGNIDLSTTPPTIRSIDSLYWLNISTNNNPDPAHVTRWYDIVLPSLIEQSWFDVHTSNLVNGNVFSRVSDDTTPKLGGALDADGKNIENLGQVQIGQLGSVVFEGFTDDAFETTLIVTDPTADRTITFPDATGTVALTTDLTAYISLATLKAEVAASTDFADFQSRIAAL